MSDMSGRRQLWRHTTSGVCASGDIDTTQPILRDPPATGNGAAAASARGNILCEKFEELKIWMDHPQYCISKSRGKSFNSDDEIMTAVELVEIL